MPVSRCRKHVWGLHASKACYGEPTSGRLGRTGISPYLRGLCTQLGTLPALIQSNIKESQGRKREPTTIWWPWTACSNIFSFIFSIITFYSILSAVSWVMTYWFNVFLRILVIHSLDVLSLLLLTPCGTSYCKCNVVANTTLLTIMPSLFPLMSCCP